MARLPTQLQPRPQAPRVLGGALGRRLSTLVLRDALQTYGVGMSLALLPLVYLYREWPPWEIRDALHGLPPSSRALLMAAAHALYGVATAPVVRQLLASERLRWWWALPLSARWWRALHLRHLVLLDAPWLLAIAYGVLPLAATAGPVHTIASGLAFAMLTLFGQIAMVSVSDRPPRWALLGLLTWALAVAAAVLVPGLVGAGLGALLLAVMVRRLGQPMPEVGARVRGRTGGPPVVALARLGWLAARRHDGMALVWGAATQLAAITLAGLAIAHVGHEDPEAAAALRRGLAVVCATIGAALVLRAVRILHGDRPVLDTWGIEAHHERSARLLLAAVGGLPALFVGSIALAGLGPVGQTWPLDLLLATAWAATHTVRLTFSLDARRRLHEPQLLRQLLWMAAALILTEVAGTPLALLPWAAFEAWRMPATQRRADHARRRFEAAVRDDHRS
ncbi:MAG: hypothetical protein AAGF11_08405 [Myxococcota bacterium]